MGLGRQTCLWRIYLLSRTQLDAIPPLPMVQRSKERRHLPWNKFMRGVALTRAGKRMEAHCRCLLTRGLPPLPSAQAQKKTPSVVSAAPVATRKE